MEYSKRFFIFLISRSIRCRNQRITNNKEDKVYILEENTIASRTDQLVSKYIVKKVEK